MKRISLHQRPGSQHGFSMLEVLITLFILSVGLLGLAAMQAEKFEDQQRLITEVQGGSGHG